MGGVTGVAEVIVGNLWGFDLLIFLLAALNFFCYFASSRAANRLYRTLHVTFFLPERIGSGREAMEAAETVKEEDVVKMRQRSLSTYTLFANLTGIFPLMGILGTVISLLPMVMDMADMQQNFFAALTSTFWGLVFAIVFKFMDGFLGAKIEENDKNVTLLLDRNSKLHEER